MPEKTNARKFKSGAEIQISVSCNGITKTVTDVIDKRIRREDVHKTVEMIGNQLKNMIHKVVFREHSCGLKLSDDELKALGSPSANTLKSDS